MTIQYRMLLSALMSSCCIALSGCGTVVPEFQEPPYSVDGGLYLVQAITGSIHCEIRDAVNYVVNQDKDVARYNRGMRSARWFDDWGVQAELTLTAEEGSTFSPTGSFTTNPVSAIFALSGGVSASSTATRVGSINYAYINKDLIKAGPCIEGDRPQPVTGSYLIQNDLKIKEWLLAHIFSVNTDAVNVPTVTDTPVQKDALTHRVKFQVVTSGSVNPSFKLIDASVNQDGPFFSTRRDRTHDILLTFGPLDPSTKRLTGSAAGTFFASQIGAAIQNSRIQGP